MPKSTPNREIFALVIDPDDLFGQIFGGLREPGQIGLVSIDEKVGRASWDDQAVDILQYLGQIFLR